MKDPRSKRIARIVPSLVAAAALLLAGRDGHTTPRHRICDDLGPTFGIGVSTFSQAGDWPTTATTTFGVHWNFVYAYVVPTTDPPAAVADYVRSKITLAQSLHAIPVMTFYEILQVGINAGFTGTEPQIVQQALQSGPTMHTYYQNVTVLLQTIADSPVPVVLQIEPDLFGFMMWSMGVDGNADATSIPVQVAGSGNADLAGLPDHAGGFGHALLALRDRYAPNVRMGWHASNWRVGERPDVVVGLYSSMGDWDVITGEQPHMEADDSQWWLPWDVARVQTNLTWFSTLSHAARLPILLWQMPLGTTDWHLFRDPSDQTMLARFADSGVAAVLFDMRGSGDPDAFRAWEIPALATVPPADSGAGGTAADMRTRVAAYSAHPMAWTAGSPCFVTSSVDSGIPIDASAEIDSGPMADTGVVPRDSTHESSSPSTPSGCGCRTPGTAERSRVGWTALALVILFSASRRKSISGSHRK